MEVNDEDDEHNDIQSCHRTSSELCYYVDNHRQCFASRPPSAASRIRCVCAGRLHDLGKEMSVHGRCAADSRKT